MCLARENGIVDNTIECQTVTVQETYSEYMFFLPTINYFVHVFIHPLPRSIVIAIFRENFKHRLEMVFTRKTNRFRRWERPPRLQNVRNCRLSCSTIPICLFMCIQIPFLYPFRCYTKKNVQIYTLNTHFWVFIFTKRVS